MRYLISLALVLLGFSCPLAADEAPVNEKDVIRYIAMGDSYTVGTGAGQDSSWPALLSAHLQREGMPVKLAILARNGWTTQNLIDQFLPLYESSSPDFATLLIGVNDWVQGVDAEAFRANFKILLTRMLAALPQKGRLLVVTIPDFSVTPAGEGFGGRRDISGGLAEFNAIIMQETKALGVPVVDIVTASREMGIDPSFVAADGLHPSALEHAVWEKMIYPDVHKMLTR